MKWILGIAIVALSLVFIQISIKNFYPEPSYRNSCNTDLEKNITTPELCTAMRGNWNESRSSCSLAASCSEAYSDAKDAYESNLFIIRLVLGVLLIVAMQFVVLPVAITYGLSVVGVILVLIASAKYWTDMGDDAKFLLSGIALATLIWLTIKKVKK